MPSFANWGEVKLARPVIDDGREAAALAELQTVNASLPFPWPASDYHSLLDILLATAGVNGPGREVSGWCAIAAIRAGTLGRGWPSNRWQAESALDLTAFPREKLMKQLPQTPERNNPMKELVVV